MNQKKTLFFATVMLVASFIAAPNAKADKAPGEGLYLGAFVGFGTGILQAKVTGLEANSRTFETERGGIGLSGIQGGGNVGWGMKTADDIYLGAELTFMGSDEKIRLTSSTPLSNDDSGIGGRISEITVQRNWSASPSVRVGYYVNQDTLFSLSGGFSVSEFDVDIGNDADTYYAGGPSMAGSLTTRLSKLDPNLSLRLDFTYTNYLTASVFDRSGTAQSRNRTTGSQGGDAANELTGHDSAGRIGVQYSF